VKPKSVGEHQVNGVNTPWDKTIDSQAFAYSVIPQGNEYATHLCVGEVATSNAMTDSGASCNLMGKLGYLGKYTAVPSSGDFQERVHSFLCIWQ